MLADISTALMPLLALSLATAPLVLAADGDGDVIFPLPTPPPILEARQTGIVGGCYAQA